jgi:hypothetical protein
MAGFMPGNLAGSMASAASSLGNLGQTIYDIEAEEEYRTGRLALVSTLEKFKESLWQDPDYGTPGQGDGYVGKYREFMQGSKATPGAVGAVGAAIGGLKNVKAQNQLSAYAQQLELEQGAEIEQLQFTKWAEGTVAKAGKRVSTLLDNGTMPAAAKLAGAYDEYAYLRDHNLITAEKAQDLMDSAAQIAIERDLFERAKTAYGEKGLSSAVQAISNDATTYSAGGASYSGGETARKLAAARMVQYDAAVQDELDGFLQSASANYRLESEWNKSHDPATEPYKPTEEGYLTHELIESKKSLTVDRKEYWHNWLDGRATTMAGAKDNKDQINQIKNFLQIAASEVDVYRNAPQTRCTVSLLGKTETLTVPELIAKINKVRKDFDGVLMTDAEYGDLWNKINPVVNGRGEGLSSGPAAVKEYLLDPKNKFTGARQAEGLIFLNNWTQADPSASPQDLLKRMQLQMGGKAYGRMGSDRFGNAIIGKDLDDNMTAAMQRGDFYGAFIDNNGTLTPGNSLNRDGLNSYIANFENTIRVGMQKKTPGAQFEAGKQYVTFWNEESGRQWPTVTTRKMRDGYPTGDGDVLTPVLDENGRTAILRETYKGGTVKQEICTDFTAFDFRPAEEIPGGRGWTLAATEKAKDAKAETQKRADTKAAGIEAKGTVQAAPGGAAARAGFASPINPDIVPDARTDPLGYSEWLKRQAAKK